MTPAGRPCIELTRLFTNILDIDNLELLNTDANDLADVREALSPGLSLEPRSPLFIGPSECDGEFVLRLPFNFQKAMSWEVTHIMIRATHPPAPGCRPPRSLGLLANLPNATFSDFEDPTVPVVECEQMPDAEPGIFVASLEPFRLKGTFRRLFCLALRFSTAQAAGADAGSDDDVGDEVYINDLALFGLPGEHSKAAGRGRMYDDRANLIVSPVMGRRRWGEETAKGPRAERPGPAADGEADD